MKKNIIWFVVIALVISMFMGCMSTKKKKTPTGLAICPEDFNIYCGVIRQDYFGRDENYSVIVRSYTGMEITSAVLTVDGTDYDMQDSYGTFMVYITLVDMEPVSCTLVINGEQTFNFELTPVSKLIVEWPDEIEFGEGFNVSWVLEPNQNPEYQEISCSLYSEEDEMIMDYKVLSPGDRSFNIPASWVTAGYYSYNYDLIAANYVIDGDLLVMAIDTSYQYYGLWGKSPEESIEKVREVAPRLYQNR